VSRYQRAVKRREKLTGSYLEAFDRALDWAALGTRSDSRQSVPNPSEIAGMQDSALQS
jgi:hypothetical protein